MGLSYFPPSGILLTCGIQFFDRRFVTIRSLLAVAAPIRAALGDFRRWLLLDRCRRSRLDRNLFPFGLLLLFRVHVDLQNPVIETRLVGVGLRTFGQRNRTIETAVMPLGHVHSVFIARLFLLALAIDDERIFGNLEMN